MPLTGSGMAAGALAETLVSAQVARNPRAPAADTSASKVKFKVGTQHSHSDAILKAMAAFGFNHICSSVPSRLDEKWSVDSLQASRTRGVLRDLAGHGADPDDLRVHHRAADARYHPGQESGARPQDRDICQKIRNCAKAGIFPVKYNFTILGIPRSAPPRAAAPRGTASSCWQRQEQGHVNDAGRSTPTRTGSASPTSSNAWCRWPRNTR